MGLYNFNLSPSDPNQFLWNMGMDTGVGAELGRIGGGNTVMGPMTTGQGLNPNGPLTPQAVMAQNQANVNAQPKGFLSGIGGIEGLSSILQGIGSVGQIYTALKGIGLAKDQLAFNKQAFQTNLANQTKSYNTTLEDKIRSRYATENRAASEADAYLAKNKL